MPLNPLLYQALTVINKNVKPKISNEGCVGSVTVYKDHTGNIRARGEGEQYAINCPFCGDKRFRLYVHHKFGTPWHVLGHGEIRLWQLAFCQNEGKCVPLSSLVEPILRNNSVPEFIQQILSRACEEFGISSSVSSESSEGIPPPTMGNTVSLLELPESHAAIQYIRSRNFDVRYVGEVCRAQFIVSHPDPRIDKMARHRIGFPFFIDGQMRTWQARLTYTPQEKFPPKWYFPPGTGSKVPWNVDMAVQFPVVIICEGIFSALRMGPAAIAIGGKTCSSSMLQLIAKRWKKAFVALDSDVGVNRPEGALDYQEKLIKELHAHGVEAIGVRWDFGDLRDPGDMSEFECMKYLQRSHPLYASYIPYLSEVI